MGTDPTQAADPSGPFDPATPAHLETLRGDLTARTGRTFRVPAPMEWPEDAGDPDTAWHTDPDEPPCVRHTDCATNTAAVVSFPTPGEFRIRGWTGEPARHFDRTGRYERVDPLALAVVLAGLILDELGVQ